MARAKKETKVEVVEERKFAAPSIESFDILVAPIVTEKSMKMQQEENTQPDEPVGCFLL